METAAQGKQRTSEQLLFWSSTSRRKHSARASLITWLPVVFCGLRIKWQRQRNTILLQKHGTDREGPYGSQHWATGPTSSDKHGYCDIVPNAVLYYCSDDCNSTGGKVINLRTGAQDKPWTLGEYFAVNKFSNEVTRPENLPLICGHSTKITATKLNAVNRVLTGETITTEKYETQLNAQKLLLHE